MIRNGTVLAAILFVAGSITAQKQAPQATTDAGGPLTYGLIVDNSGSFRTILERVITSANSIIDNSREGDEGFLVTFVDTAKIKLRQEMTDDRQSLKDSADNMFIEGGPTAILDAVMFSAKYLSKNAKADAERSRALILITDGDDRESATSIDDALKILKANKIRVFVLGLYDEKFYGKVVDRLTKETGGAKFVPKTPKEVSAAVSSLADAIRAN